MMMHRSFCLAILVLSIGETLHAQGPDPAVAALQNAITRLNDQVVDLSKENSELTKRVSTLEMEAAPIGAVMAFAGPLEAIPPNWRLCNGDVITRSQDTEALFQVVKTSWGGSRQRSFFQILGDAFYEESIRAPVTILM